MSIERVKANPTLQEVAAAAGVSKSTVSLVVNNDTRVQASTAATVRRALAELGYQALPPACRRGPKIRPRKRLNHQQIGLLFAGKKYWLKAPVFTNVLHAVEQRLRQDGWNLVVRAISEDEGEDILPARLDGVLLLNVEHIPARLLRQLRELAVVRVMGKPTADDLFDHVTYDNHKIGGLAASYLLNRGHRCVATVSAAYSFFRQRQEDFCAAARDGGTVVHDRVNSFLVTETEQSEFPNLPRLTGLIEEFKALPVQPTAIYASSDILAVGVFHALCRCGLLPGRDMEIVGTNNESALLNCLDPRPASVDIHAERVGARAAEQLFWRLNHPCEPRKLILEEPEMGFE